MLSLAFKERKAASEKVRRENIPVSFKNIQDRPICYELYHCRIKTMIRHIPIYFIYQIDVLIRLFQLLEVIHQYIYNLTRKHTNMYHRLFHTLLEWFTNM